MDSDSASRRSLLGLAGVASLCCLGTGGLVVGGTAAVAGGAATGSATSGYVQLAVTLVTLGVIGALLRFRTRRSDCQA
ncbi:hypothetical protein [Natrinema salsiterrestre]|uniref:Uncharacterized protein n=1 Tax=Natrinema salsiterrestre TaxID=2950540 RepID=A0A9Q4L4W0_9EURY|nr:hypothetical protein [Natrinema salsiterrestre]MDF9745346.1 hypothetical protein [Natrinema salsiterrestre]